MTFWDSVGLIAACFVWFCLGLLWGYRLGTYSDD